MTVVSNAMRTDVGSGARSPREASWVEVRARFVSGLKDCIARAVDGLSEAYRTTLIMHDIEGYTHAEIAGILGVPEGTSKSRLSAARAQLRQDLAAFRE